MKTELLVIDPQIDFCMPESDPLARFLPLNFLGKHMGALYVQNAEQDIARIAALVTRSLDLFDDIRVTLDSHQPVHIAHGLCWVGQDGKHPGPFTMITEADVTGANPKWKAYNPAWQARQVAYVKALAAGRRYVLIIWPPHCRISSIGQAVMPILDEALLLWQNQFAMIDYVTKGSNPFTEHYSVVKADVPDDDDLANTGLNKSFIKRLQEADQIFIAGQALSHCVANSVRDIATEFGDENVKKMVLLEDCSSPVGDLPGSTMFADMAAQFIKDMTAKGMRVCKSTDI